jgi:hypothetical protein
MQRYLAGVLSVIAVGTLLIAYGLLSPRVSAQAGYDPLVHPVLTSEAGRLYGQPYAYTHPAAGYPASTVYPAAGAYPVSYSVAAPQGYARPVPAVITEPAPQRVVTRTVERGPRRDWGKTALIIGGSTAAGAGVGGIMGGKKGALIGAAIGGGASTIFESVKK